MANDVKDLNSHEWYHGPITRQAAVSLLEADGDFLVRDCISNPGDYVLTCMTNGGKVLHFKLNKSHVGQDSYYQFEGDLFPSAADLILHHLVSREPVSYSTNAVISTPKIFSKILVSQRSQSSLSGDCTSGSSSGDSSLTKSGSRASLLKDSSKDCQLKRFKSLPAGKIRRIKRRAPSPPKDQKPLQICHEEKQPKPAAAEPKKVVPASLLEGVKLRRKKFVGLIPKPLSLSQRQSMHITAGLQDHLRKGLTEDKRRYSMPRLLDEEDSEEEPTAAVTNLVRSPSDTSLIYLHQMVHRMQNGNNGKRSHKPPLPSKKRPHGEEALQVANNEAIYDCLPAPRSCLTDRQIQYNVIYDEPRKLVVPGFSSEAIRSVSAFGPWNGQQNAKSDCQSVCSLRSRVTENGGRKLNRHRNFEQGLDRPALPPKSSNGLHRCHKADLDDMEGIYNVPRKLDDSISLCSTFSYCSECTNTSTGLTEDTLSTFSEDHATPFRFSPTSYLSEYSLSLQDLNGEAEKKVSTVSSVSSITLQGDDISLDYDATSLPGDPFPQGLPSSASSTIGSPVSSKSSYSLTEDYKHNDEPILSSSRTPSPSHEHEKILQDQEELERPKTKAEEVPDIFNHRSSSRAIRRPKSQPNSLCVADEEVWTTKGSSHARKSLSPRRLFKSSQDDLGHQSLFDPASFLTLYLPGSGNKPLDPLAVSAVHRTLVDTPAPTLAVHLTLVDMCLLGLQEQGNLKKGSLWLLTEPLDERYAIDILERYLCMKTLVIVTILAASNISESAKILAKWVRLADELERRLKNYFGFRCLASGLVSSPHLMNWNQLWYEVKGGYPDEWQLLNEAIPTVMKSGWKVEVATVPDVVPFALAKVNWDEEESRLWPISGAASVERCAAMSETFKKNGQVLRHIKCPDDLLLDLFRTEFHIRLFWGSNGVAEFPQNFKERHAKFARVLSALAAICSRQY